jgi:hypothetical protein
VDYDPNRDIQVYSGQQNMTPADRTKKKLCPSWIGGNNYWSASYSRKTKLLYIPSASSCNEATLDPAFKSVKVENNIPLAENVLREIANGALYGGVQKYTERNESDIVLLDPVYRRGQEEATQTVSQSQRSPHDGRRPPLHGLHRWIVRGL